MNRIACSGILLTLLALAACAIPPGTPLKSLEVAAAPSPATLPKKAALAYLSSNMDGNVAAPVALSGNVLYAVPADEVEPHYFNRQDQADTVAALQANLQRLKVFDAVELNSAAAAPDLKIMVVFDDSFYEAAAQRYTLKVTLQVQGGKQRLRKEYQAQSNPQGSLMHAMALTSQRAKAEAAQALLQQLLADLQAFAAAEA